jgi:histidine ammonia-lyase
MFKKYHIDETLLIFSVAFPRNGAPVVVDGQNLSIAEVIAVARHAAVVRLTKEWDVHARVNAAHEIVQNKLSEGKSVYGISTGPCNVIRVNVWYLTQYLLQDLEVARTLVLHRRQH